MEPEILVKFHCSIQHRLPFQRLRTQNLAQGTSSAEPKLRRHPPLTFDNHVHHQHQHHRRHERHYHQDPRIHRSVVPQRMTGCFTARRVRRLSYQTRR